MNASLTEANLPLVKATVRAMMPFSTSSWILDERNKMSSATSRLLPVRRTWWKSCLHKIMKISSGCFLASGPPPPTTFPTRIQWIVRNRVGFSTNTRHSLPLFGGKVASLFDNQCLNNAAYPNVVLNQQTAAYCSGCSLSCQFSSCSSILSAEANPPMRQKFRRTHITQECPS